MTKTPKLKFANNISHFTVMRGLLGHVVNVVVSVMRLPQILCMLLVEKTILTNDLPKI